MYTGVDCKLSNGQFDNGISKMETSNINKIPVRIKPI